MDLIQTRGSRHWKCEAENHAKEYLLYGFHINGSESDPHDAVSYLEDASGMMPAYMDFSSGKFNYGGWQNAFFMPKPCILGQNGVVQKYLNPNDYAKDVDGNSVTIGSGLTGANVMIEFPKIWMKVVPDSDSKSGSVYISNKKIDNSYLDLPYIASNKSHKDHFYMAAYNGSFVNNVLRSLSGMQVEKTTTIQDEVSRATSNGSGWYIEDYGKVMLINALLVLMGKSLNTQAVYGKGLTTDSTTSIDDSFRTGIHNQRGLFYGTNSGVTSTYANAVKVFGIENWWGYKWRKYAGDININGTRKIKMCWGREDGSTTDSFNFDGSGYVNEGITPTGTSGRCISEAKFISGKGFFPKGVNGSSSTYFCDSFWYNNSLTTYAMRGGRSLDDLNAGAFSMTNDQILSNKLATVCSCLAYA